MMDKKRDFYGDKPRKTDGEPRYDKKKGAQGKFGRDNDRQPDHSRFGKDNDRQAERGRFGKDNNRQAERGRFGKDNDRQAERGRFGKDNDRQAERGRFGKDNDRQAEHGRFGKDNDRQADYGKFKKDNDRPRGRHDEQLQTNVRMPENSIEESTDKLEGRNSVLEAIKSDRTINKILVSKGDREGSIKQIIALAREKGIVVQETDRASLDKISTSYAHQGVIAFVAEKEYVEVEDILAIANDKGEVPFIVILDGITDPHNLGSVLRTANAAGVHGVIIPKRRAIGLTAAVSKASAGAIEYVPVARVTNISQTIEYLKQQGLWIVGTDQSGEKSFFDTDLKGPIALVIGSEGEGMGKLISQKCDFVVNLPMKGQISSLNAAVAGAIVMYEILKQRHINGCKAIDKE